MIVIKSKIGVGNKVNIPKVIREICDLDMDKDLLWQIKFEDGKPCAYITQETEDNTYIIEQ